MKIINENFSSTESTNTIPQIIIYVLYTMIMFWLLNNLINFIVDNTKLAIWVKDNWTYWTSLLIAIFPFIANTIKKLNTILRGDILYYNITDAKIYEGDNYDFNLTFNLKITSQFNSDFLKIDKIIFEPLKPNCKYISDTEIWNNCYVNHEKWNYITVSKDDLKTYEIKVNIIDLNSHFKNLNQYYIQIILKDSHISEKHPYKYQMRISFLEYFDKNNNPLK